MNIRFAVLALILAGFAVAQSSVYRLVMSGQVSSEKAIVVAGRTYIPLSTLKTLGVSSSLNGNTLRNASSQASPGQQPRAHQQGRWHSRLGADPGIAQRLEVHLDCHRREHLLLTHGETRHSMAREVMNVGGGEIRQHWIGCSPSLTRMFSRHCV
jgi:hypothetical protein